MLIAMATCMVYTRTMFLSVMVEVEEGLVLITKMFFPSRPKRIGVVWRKCWMIVRGYITCV